MVTNGTLNVDELRQFHVYTEYHYFHLEIISLTNRVLHCPQCLTNCIVHMLKHCAVKQSASYFVYVK